MPINYIDISRYNNIADECCLFSGHSPRLRETSMENTGVSVAILLRQTECYGNVVIGAFRSEEKAKATAFDLCSKYGEDIRTYWINTCKVE